MNSSPIEPPVEPPIEPAGPADLSGLQSAQKHTVLEHSIQAWQRSGRWRLGLGLVGVLGTLLIGMFIVKGSSRADAPASSSTETAATGNTLPVETIRAQQISRYEVARTYTGEVATLKASELGFERSGQLTALLVPEGSRVQAGEALAQLDTQNLQAQRLQIEAEKSRAIAQFTELEVGPRNEDIAVARAAVQDLEQQIGLQRTQLARREILYEKGAISQEALDEFRFGEGSLQARLEQSRSQLQELQNGTRPEQISAQNALIQQLDARLADIDVTIAKSTLSAPFNGTVAEHNADIGTVVGAGQSVIRLVESDLPEARVGLPVNAITKLNLGEERTLNISGQQYTGSLAAILPEVDPQTRTQTAVFTLEARAATRISPGQTARLNLTNSINAQGFWLPSEALTQGIRGLWTCYVVIPQDGPEGEENTTYVVQPQSVEVIHQEGDRVFVTGTLQPEDQVVASGSHRLVPGQQVRPSGETFVTD
ncbi:MAG: efflux RND transporter periplasmic adaptor subunit [Cyanobacteria bacterium J06598_3]